jgi:hypothetical protein
MSIIIMGIALSVLEAMCETFIAIKNAFERKLDLMIFRYNVRSSRCGHRADFTTRVRYKLESIFDNLITPK